jgi:hypothetical protein
VERKSESKQQHTHFAKGYEPTLTINEPPEYFVPESHVLSYYNETDAVCLGVSLCACSLGWRCLNAGVGGQQAAV